MLTIGVAKVLDRSESLLTTLEATVSENRQTLKGLATRVDGVVQRMDTLASELTVTVQRTGEVVGEARKPLVRALDEGAGLMADLRQTRQRLDSTLSGLETLVADGRQVLGADGARQTLERLNILLKRTSLMVVQSREGIVDAVSYLRETTENLSHFSRKVREDPSLLLLAEDDEEVE